MDRSGKTETSFDSPHFFHIKQVPTVTRKKSISQKFLKPEYQKCSPDNLLSNPSLPLAPTRSTPRFDYQEHSFKPENKGLNTFRPTQSIDLLSGNHLSYHFDSPYYAQYLKVLSSSGFGLNKTNFSKEIENPKITRNETTKLSILKNKFGRLSYNKDSFPAISTMERNYKNSLKEISQKSSDKLRILSNEIQDFENKLNRLLKLPKLA